MRWSFLLGASVLLVPNQADATQDKIARGPVPGWASQSELLAAPDNPSGLIFVRRQDVMVHLDQHGQEQYLNYRIRILHPTALSLGNLSITWNPAAGTPVVHVIKIYRDAQVIDVLQTSAFDVLRREDQLEAARLDGNLTAVMRVSDLRVGDELEVGVTVPAGDPTLGKAAAGVLHLNPDPAPGRYRLGVSWEKALKPRLQMSEDIAALGEIHEQSIVFQFDNPPLVLPPKDAPARYHWQRAVEFSGLPDWATLSRRFSGLFETAAQLSAASPLKEEARRIAAAHADPIDRAAAALKLVQRDVRYIYVGLNGGNLTPASADETWQRRYGDCKAKTVLLMALLKELGISAAPVLVNSSEQDDGLDQRLPGVQFFDHVLVRARIGGASYWLDGTLPPAAAPSTAPLVPFKWVLPVTPAGSTLEHQDWRPAAQPDEITLLDLDARGGFDVPAKVINTTIYRGLKGLEQQVRLSSLTEDKLTTALRQELVGSLWQSVDSVKWHYNEKIGASILTIRGAWKVKWEDEGNGGKSFALPGGGFSPPDSRIRPADDKRHVPFANKPNYDCYVTTVRLPTSTKLADWSTKPSFDVNFFGQAYHRAFDIRDGSIRMVRGFRVDKQEIDADLASHDNDRLMNFDNSMGWISYDPSSHIAAMPAQTKVPAPDEIDWTANTVPCLSASELSLADGS